ncbi:MAG: M6 family metalloprotease domain-containing protein [Prevotella sp.]|nr:M6 family metalloprotease domain-containing protein [Prevotella sp.]
MKRQSFFLVAVALLTAVPQLMRGIPAYPGRVGTTLVDGRAVGYSLVGDEHRHAFVSDDGYVLRFADGQRATASRLMTLGQWQADGTAQPRRAPRHLATGGFPTTGSVRGMVMLVEFSDVHFQTGNTAATYERQMNQEGYADYGGTGSARDYFVSQSMGQFTPQFDVVGPIRLSRPMAFYGADDEGGTDAGAGLMVEEACRLAHEQGVDFSQYDYDADGDVDFVFFVIAGYGQNYGADANTIWPHTATLPDWGITLTLDGKRLNRYACGCELKYTQGTTREGIGTFCHEFGHVLGLPDFYDTRHKNSTRLGPWSIMDQGCYLNESRTPCAYSAFERYSLGWLTFDELQEPGAKQLAELTQTGTAYRISTARSDEYFTLENRQQVGWDAYLPARGLLVAHVDYDQTAWEQNTVNNGDDMRFDLVEADGVMSADTYATDLFPSNGKDRFTDTTTPAMLSRQGEPTGKPIIKIRDVEGVITFRFMQDVLSQPEPPVVSDVSDVALTASWQPVEGAVAYRLQAQELLSAAENPVVADESFSAMTAGSMAEPDNAEMGSVLDAYLAQQGWSGSSLRQAGGWLYVADGGKLTSPLLDLSEPDGRFTVALSVEAKAGTAPQLSIVAARNNGREIASQTFTVGDGEQVVVAQMEGGIGRTRITVGASGGDVFIGRLRILKDHVAEADVWTDAAHVVTADRIAATTCTLTGLQPGRDYSLTLTALSDDADLDSEPSSAVLVTMKQQGAAIATPRLAGGATYYNILGQRLSSARGLHIEQRQTAGGTVVTKKVGR